MPLSALSTTELIRLYGPWAGRTPVDAARLMAGYPGPWWISGGWAIEAFTGSARTHDDLDLEVLRIDLPLLRRHFAGHLDLWTVDDGALCPLLPGDQPDAEPDSVLPDGCGQLWARPSGTRPWEYDVLLMTGLLIEHQHEAAGSTSEALDGDEPEPDHHSLELTAPADLTHAAAVVPGVVLHFHLSDSAVDGGHGVVRPEHGEPTSLQQLRTWLAETGCHVTVRPVHDPAGMAAVDAYETPLRMRDALLARHPAEVFPFGAAVRRNLDTDHTIPYVAPSRGGPPGQTGLHNLGPLARGHHRAVTHGRWRHRQPEPGTYVFRSPHDYVFVVTNQGTINLGCTDFAADVWRRARQEPAQDQAAA